MAKKVKEMKKYHEVEQVVFTDSVLVLNIDGKRHEFMLENISEPLSKATAEERNQHEVSPSGYGIHWPLLDEDLSIDGLLGIVHTPLTK